MTWRPRSVCPQPPSLWVSTQYVLSLLWTHRESSWLELGGRSLVPISHHCPFLLLSGFSLSWKITLTFSPVSLAHLSLLLPPWVALRCGHQGRSFCSLIPDNQPSSLSWLYLSSLSRCKYILHLQTYFPSPGGSPAFLPVNWTDFEHSIKSTIQYIFFMSCFVS